MDVTGIVLEGDKPLINAEVEFYPLGEGAPSYGRTNDKGEFSLNYSTGKKGAVLGQHRVVIVGGSTDAAAAKVADVDPGNETPVPVAQDQPPKKRDTDLSAEVKNPGPNHFEFKL